MRGWPNLNHERRVTKMANQADPSSQADSSDELRRANFDSAIEFAIIATDARQDERLLPGSQTGVADVGYGSPAVSRAFALTDSNAATAAARPDVGQSLLSHAIICSASLTPARTA